MYGNHSHLLFWTLHGTIDSIAVLLPGALQKIFVTFTIKDIKPILLVSFIGAHKIYDCGFEKQILFVYKTWSGFTQ